MRQIKLLNPSTENELPPVSHPLVKKEGLVGWRLISIFLFGSLELGFWDLFDICYLELGALDG